MSLIHHTLVAILSFADERGNLVFISLGYFSRIVAYGSLNFCVEELVKCVSDAEQNYVMVVRY